MSVYLSDYRGTVRDKKGICIEIAIHWGLDDVLIQAKNDNLRITKKEAGQVLELLQKNHDACNGISWETISYYIQEVISEREN